MGFESIILALCIIIFDWWSCSMDFESIILALRIIIFDWWSCSMGFDVRTIYTWILGGFFRCALVNSRAILTKLCFSFFFSQEYRTIKKNCPHSDIRIKKKKLLKNWFIVLLLVWNRFIWNLCSRILFSSKVNDIRMVFYGEILLGFFREKLWMVEMSNTRQYHL